MTAPKSTKCDMSLNIPFYDRKWHWFILSVIAIYGAGLVLIIIGRCILWLMTRKKRNNNIYDDEVENDNVELHQGWYLDLKEGAGNLVSGQTLQGRVLVGY